MEQYPTKRLVKTLKAYLAGVALTLVAAQDLVFQPMLTIWFVVHLVILLNSKHILFGAALGMVAGFLCVAGVYTFFAPDLQFELVFIFSLYSACMAPLALISVLLYRRVKRNAVKSPSE